MARAAARHILVKTKEEAEQIKQLLANGGDFTKLAKKHSICSTAKRGGDLGEFGPGKMVKAVDNVVFKKPVLKVPSSAWVPQQSTSLISYITKKRNGLPTMSLLKVAV